MKKAKTPETHGNLVGGWVLHIKQGMQFVITLRKRIRNNFISFGWSFANVRRTLVLTKNILMMIKSMHQN